MWMLNMQKRYQMIRQMIINASPEVIIKLVEYYGFKNNKFDDVEYRRRELLEYLDEMHKCWNEHNIDLTDRQFIKLERKRNK